MRAPARPTEFDGGAIGNGVPYSFAVGAWRPIALCGRGGTAEVWQVAAADGRQAALKRLKPALRLDARARERLRGELALLEALASPALVAPIELVEHGDGPAVVLEYLPNGDLVSLLGAPARFWLPALRTVLAALTCLHERGVAHGDLKARNVLFAADRSARVVDLMAARPVDAPAGRSTAAYGLPAGVRATARAADCFAFAVLLHELATAQLPYGEAGPASPVSLGEIEPAAAPGDPAAARLLAAARPMLAAGGGLAQGLSYFADVIESVGRASA